MCEQARAVHGIHAAVPVQISQQPNLRVLRLRAGGHGHRILPGDMIFLRHLHGVGAGSDAGNGVGGGIPFYGGVVCRRRGAAIDKVFVCNLCVLHIQLNSLA